MFKNLRYYILLTRPINLAIILCTQVLFMMHSGGFKLSNILFPACIFVILATLLTAAAGNVINDIFDIEEDQINNPEKRIIARHISLRNGRVFYIALAAASLIAGWLAGWTMFALCMAIGIMLYFYSSDLKGSTLWGNLLVGFMAGATVFASGLGVYARFDGYFAEYALFAFFITVPREIIKDIEDIEGDRAQEYETFPIEFGVSKAVLLSAIYLLLIAGETLYLMVKDGNIWFNLYATLLILAPVVYISLKLKNASEKKDFTIIQRLLKLLMVTGMISVLLL